MSKKIKKDAMDELWRPSSDEESSNNLFDDDASLWENKDERKSVKRRLSPSFPRHEEILWPSSDDEYTDTVNLFESEDESKLQSSPLIIFLITDLPFADNSMPPIL